MPNPGNLLRPTWLSIDLDALASNFRRIRSIAGPADSVKICAVIKADAYGLGAVPVARTLAACGCDYFGVALVEEGVELRQAGISTPVVHLGALAGEQSALAAARHDIDVAVHSIDSLRHVHAAARSLGGPIKVHLKIDSGMGRLGVLPQDVEQWCSLVDGSLVELVGIYTTFAQSQKLGLDRTGRQFREFERAVGILRARGLNPTLVHAANSGALINHPQTRLSMVRPGLLLYGLAPDPAGHEEGFEPVAALRTRVIQLQRHGAGSAIGYSGSFRTERESLIAVLPAGYADGVSRGLGNAGEVIIRGRRAPIVGHVSMDLTTVDVTDLPGARLGDVATIMGRDGGEEISAWEIAERIGTIAWEVLTLIGGRVPRVQAAAGERGREEAGVAAHENRS